MYNHWLFFTYWLVNSLVIWFVGAIFPQDLVLGTWRFTAAEAAIYSGFWVTFVVWIFWDFLLARRYKFSRLLNFFWFWLANTLGIWLMAHINHYSGLGISAYYWAIVLGLVVNLAQSRVRKFYLG